MAIYHSRIEVLQIAPLLAKADALIILVSVFIHEKINVSLDHGQNIKINTNLTICRWWEVEFSELLHVRNVTVTLNNVVDQHQHFKVSTVG